jgi:hypothetical protein
LEVTFSLDDAEWSAQFNSKGDWKESTKKMDFDSLPEAVKDALTRVNIAIGRRAVFA